MSAVHVDVALLAAVWVAVDLSRLALVCVAVGGHPAACSLLSVLALWLSLGVRSVRAVTGPVSA